ncbi:MAG TPA: Flp pilus assembly protein CpaB [Methylocella sp.]|jgi:pilus assembly protein CpaB|nr:Flp pilus assembly protein CpaB [Methylocella sp.]
MKIARLAVLGTALVAGIGAAILASESKQPAIAAPPPPLLTDGVLVAAKELNFGVVVDESDLRWEDWPKDHIPEGLVRKSVSPGGIEELRGSIVRSNFAAGEPLKRDRLVKGPHSGFLASVLSKGNRAVAINIDAQGSSTAGGFILPNDRVDVIHIFQDQGAARNGIANSFVSQTILTNIRVLAIGQNYQEKNGERVISGANATLELTPFQAETIVLAQRAGQLSLILRSMTDANAAVEPPPQPQQPPDVGPQRRGKPRQGALSTRRRASNER